MEDGCVRRQAAIILSNSFCWEYTKTNDLGRGEWKTIGARMMATRKAEARSWTVSKHGCRPGTTC